jgi:hypothetical protein
MVNSLTLKRPKQFLTVPLLTQYTVKKRVTVTSLPLITVEKNLSSLSYCNDHKIRSLITTVNTKKWCLLPLIIKASQRSYRGGIPTNFTAFFLQTMCEPLSTGACVTVMVPNRHPLNSCFFARYSLKLIFKKY